MLACGVQWEVDGRRDWHVDGVGETVQWRSQQHQRRHQEQNGVRVSFAVTAAAHRGISPSRSRPFDNIWSYGDCLEVKSRGWKGGGFWLLGLKFRAFWCILGGKEVPFYTVQGGSIQCKLVVSIYSNTETSLAMSTLATQTFTHPTVRMAPRCSV